MTSIEDLISVTFENGDKPEPLEKVLRPSTFFSWILGVGIARPLKSSKFSTFFLRFINFGICSSIVAYGAIDFFFFGSVFKSDTFKIMYYMNKVACYISSYYYVFHGLVQYKKWPILMERIANIDKKMMHCGLECNNKSIRRFQIFTIIMTCLLGPASLISHALYYLYTRPEEIFASDLLLYHTISQSLCVNFEFNLLVFGVYTRFKEINRGIRRSGEQISAGRIIAEIRKTRDVHHGLCSLVRYINSIHGVHLLLSSLNSFTMVVATLFRIYMGVVEGIDKFMMINNVIWLTYTAQFALTCFICTWAFRESSKTGIIIHDIVLRRLPKGPRPCDLYSVDITRASEDPELALRNEINDFSAQLDHCSIAFSACEFFTMNNNLLTNFVGVITTYLIILMQFYMPENCHADMNTTPSVEL
ncbi:putative gustatory receptor 23a, isoform B [Fopius arisanus]|uniref:Gustatory receptor n=1 Tax=Fopius arisanus TaxID=64838 RepID=A0A9R1U999_9HYME|nr:PREDICTED: putative gustatory receptor 23a, isoform B [Fopius arisanus]